jgi:uncharacterized protein (DUF1501 family)
MASNEHSTRTRRSVLSLGAKAAAALGVTHLTSRPARAASSGNSAVVCLYLLGGNDSNNMIVPLDSPAYGIYAKGRGPLAIPRSDLLSVYSTANSATYGFHPALSGLRDLYNQGSLAVLANVGRSEAPLSSAQVRATPGSVPADLFQHTGASRIRYLPDAYLGIPWAAPDANGKPIRSLRHGISLVSLHSRGDQGGALMAGATAALLRTAFPETFTGQQMHSIAQALKVKGAGQQAFVCPVAGFDTHADELSRQAQLFGELNDALVAFSRSLDELGIADRVTLFTQTEFNRTLRPNARGGTEHGWGGHALILGGSTLGGQVYGRFPSLELGGPDDLDASGVWIPSTSDLQYSATVAMWFGGDDLSSLPDFAGLPNFTQTDLGFLAR